MELWYIRNRHGAEKLWKSYIMYRVQNETDQRIGRFVEIRMVAEEYCRHAEAEYDATIDGLCLLALERGVHCPGYREGWMYHSYRADEPSNPGLNLLSAAAYFGCIPLARRLLSEGHCPTAENRLFPPPIQIAAWVGNVDMLTLFQEHLPDFEEIPPRYEKERTPWRAKVGPGSIKGAALRGDMNMLRLAIYPPSRSNTNTTDFYGQPFGQIDYKPETGDIKPSSDLYDALYYVKTVEVFQYIDSFFQESILLSRSADLLVRYADLGNVEMVRHILDTGVIGVHGSTEIHNQNPLHIAAQNCHEDIVDLLLERGADPNSSKLQQRGTPLHAAVVGGSLSIVQKLFDSGARVPTVDPFFLRKVVEREDIAILELCVDYGVSEVKMWSYIQRWASEEGLNYVANLVQQKVLNRSNSLTHTQMSM